MDIRTIIIILGFTHLMQVAVFFHQYRVNKTYPGVGWWLMWSAAEIIAFVAMLFRNIPSLLPAVVIVQNSMLIAGTVFLYAGVRRFFNLTVNLKIIIPVVTVFFFGLLWFLFIDDNIEIRSIFIDLALTTISFLTAYSLIVSKTRSIKSSAHFNALIFIIHGCVFLYRAVMTAAGTPSGHFFVPTLFNILPFLDALIVGLLWTFGLIMMLNHRLNADMSEAKEDLELIFNTSPDAAIITRMDDGQIVDINDGYMLITGYSREEMEGKSTPGINIWKNIGDRNKIVMLLRENGYCENYEAVFIRKDGVEITGLMSAKIINLQGIPHIISITRNITERKQSEEALAKKIDELQRFHNLTVDRELAMIELKKEVNELLKKRGSEEKYRIIE